MEVANEELLKKNMKSPLYCKICFVFTGLLVCCQVMFAQPGQIHLSLPGTVENNNTSMYLSWCEDGNAGKQSVRYGKTAEIKNRLKARPDPCDSLTIYHCTLKNLDPSTRYYYRCGSAKAGWSEPHSFNTPPGKVEEKSFKVAIIGDTQNNEFNETFQKTGTIIRQVAALQPDLILHMGDMVNNGSVVKDWLQLLDTIQPLTTIAPIMPTLGNHDVENKTDINFQKPFPLFNKLFHLPGNNTDYAFDYGNTHFVSVFSGVAPVAAGNGRLKYSPGSPERKWLEEDLQKARKNQDIKWIIVFTHYPVYSFGWSNVQQWKETLAPILDKYTVDMCLSGHRHAYERHYPVNGGKRADHGTVYITNGTAGGSPQGTGGQELPTMVFTPKERMYNYALMTIDSKAIKYQVYNNKKEIIDEFELR
jgi:acid phosphatase type 7